MYTVVQIVLASLNVNGMSIWLHTCALFWVTPGKDYRHQLELIFNVVGSPSDNYINMTSNIIGDFLRSKCLLCTLC